MGKSKPLSPAQAKDNRFDNKRRRAILDNRGRESMERRKAKPYTLFLYPDYILSFKGKPKLTKGIIISFRDPVKVSEVEKRVWEAFGDL